MLKTLGAITMFTVSSIAAAQDYPAPSAQHTTAPAGARFEIVQSSLAQNWTFRLDRQTGYVAKLYNIREDVWEWRDTPVVERPTNSDSANHFHFQLHLSGLSFAQTLLIDVDTGKTWQPVKGKVPDRAGKPRDGYVWQPVSADSLR